MVGSRYLPLRNAALVFIISSTDFGILSCRRLISLSVLRYLHSLRIVPFFVRTFLHVSAFWGQFSFLLNGNFGNGSPSMRTHFSLTPSLVNMPPSLLSLSPSLCLGDSDLSRLILKKTLGFGSGLLDMLRERLYLSLLLRSPLSLVFWARSVVTRLIPRTGDNTCHSTPDAGLFGFSRVYSFPFPIVCRTADMRGVGMRSAGSLMLSEMALFFHFGPNTFTGDKWSSCHVDPSVFNPTRSNATQWVIVAKENGFSLVMLIAKHHHGFCLWPSDYTEHEVTYGKTLEYNDYCMAQITELLTRYGNVKEVFEDSGKGEDSEDMQYFFRIGLYLNGLNLIGGGDPLGHDWEPPECDVSIQPGWFWNPSKLPKPATFLLNLNYNSVGRNCPLLLNVPPNFPGLTYDEDVKVQELIQMGQRIVMFHVDAVNENGEWREVLNGTTVGYTRLLQFPTVKTHSLRFVIDNYRADPLVAYLGLHIEKRRVNQPDVLHQIMYKMTWVSSI
uniref:alpha-L-fucosidase n=1 Tax=Tanacetum cinerariifolium TaxID=118510 RepID=A0A6L2LYR6_TANCI|nr:hypothetical protein [Tanacetum cinerariifolium]